MSITKILFVAAQLAVVAGVAEAQEVEVLDQVNSNPSIYLDLDHWDATYEEFRGSYPNWTRSPYPTYAAGWAYAKLVVASDPPPDRNLERIGAFCSDLTLNWLKQTTPIGYISWRGNAGESREEWALRYMVDRWRYEFETAEGEDLEAPLPFTSRRAICELPGEDRSIPAAETLLATTGVVGTRFYVRIVEAAVEYADDDIAAPAPAGHALGALIVNDRYVLIYDPNRGDPVRVRRRNAMAYLRRYANGLGYDLERAYVGAPLQSFVAAPDDDVRRPAVDRLKLRINE